MQLENFTNKLTIAIPVYNRETYFEEALLSAINQTTRCNIIVYDNASDTDFFRLKCAEYGVSYYRQPENVGMFANWNSCMSTPNTEFVYILGDDDLLRNNYVERFLRALEIQPELDLFYSDFKLINGSGMFCGNHKHKLLFGSLDSHEVKSSVMKHGLSYPSVTAAIRRSKFNGYESQFHASNDWLWFYSNYESLNVFGDSECLVSYRVHKENESRNTLTKLSTSISILFILKNVLNLPWTFYEFKVFLRASILMNQKDSKRLLKLDNPYIHFFNRYKSKKIVSYLPVLLIRFIYKLLQVKNDK